MERTGREGCERPGNPESVDDWVISLLADRAITWWFKEDDIDLVRRAATDTGTSCRVITSDDKEACELLSANEWRLWGQGWQPGWKLNSQLSYIDNTSRGFLERGFAVAALACGNEQPNLNNFWKTLEDRCEQPNSNSVDSELSENPEDDELPITRESLGDGCMSMTEGERETPTSLVDMVRGEGATARPAKDSSLAAINILAACEAGLGCHRITDYNKACELLVAENQRRTGVMGLDVGHIESYKPDDSELLEEVAPFVECLMQNGGAVIVIEHRDGERQLDEEFYTKYRRLKETFDSGNSNEMRY